MKEFFREFWLYAKERKKFWLIPIVVVILIVGLLIFSVKVTVGSPFIYTIF